MVCQLTPLLFVLFSQVSKFTNCDLVVVSAQLVRGMCCRGNLCTLDIKRRRKNVSKRLKLYLKFVIFVNAFVNGTILFSS